jgi:predicted RNA binding protein YcfA (HicA-like mRNA interferase family)
MLEAIGFRRLRSGKGDHTIYARGADRVSIDGSPSKELKKGTWESLRKKYGLGGGER